jgi:GNAT superfamily N-acetyltransferase
MSNFHYALSPLDEARFGVRTVQARNIEAGNIAELEQFCQDEQVQFVIVRVSANQLDLVQTLEANDYRLMDTIVYYAFKFGKKGIPQDSNSHKIRPQIASDIDEVIAIASESFKGYFGHYHADPRLDKAKCDEVYIDWAANSVKSRQVADEVLIVEGEKGLNGFATLRKNSAEEGEGVLFGVAPHAQGQGIYQTMMIGGMNWVQAQGASQMVVSTQVTNIAVQKVWSRLGFEMDRAYYTLHKWY